VIRPELVEALSYILPDVKTHQGTLFQEIEQFKKSSAFLQETTRETIVQSRIGQGQFRLSLIAYWQGCSVTGCSQVEILKASHIKPWRDCTNDERLNVYNGLLLLPNLDACFDIGFVSFSDEGKIGTVHKSPIWAKTPLQITQDSHQICSPMWHSNVFHVEPCHIIYRGIRKKNTTKNCKSVFCST
jgi:hypothetical protein